MDEIDIPEYDPNVGSSEEWKELNRLYGEHRAYAIRDELKAMKGEKVGVYIQPPSIEDEVDNVLDMKIRQEKVEKEVEIRSGYIKQFGTDSYDEDAVIRFPKRFTTGKEVKSYTYAAIKKAGMWYTTGPSGHMYSWDELVRWLVSGPEPTRMHEIAELTAIRY